MSVISLGDEIAIGLGIRINRMMFIQLIISVGAAAIATAVVGPLGFIGLLAPHLGRKLVNAGPANQLLISAYRCVLPRLQWAALCYSLRYCY